MRSIRALGFLSALALAAAAAACSKERSDSPPASGPSTAAPRAPSKPADAAVASTTAPPHDDESEHHEELPTKVRLPPSVVRSAGIKVAAATSDSLPATVDLTGEIAADPDKSARLAARVPGRIVDVKVKEGGRVTAGQTVAVLESPELARARATLASAGARAK
jgi:membrane fusion protein, heavy metal efflux system